MEAVECRTTALKSAMMESELETKTVMMDQTTQWAAHLIVSTLALAILAQEGPPPPQMCVSKCATTTSLPQMKSVTMESWTPLAAQVTAKVSGQVSLALLLLTQSLLPATTTFKNQLASSFVTMGLGLLAKAVTMELETESGAIQTALKLSQATLVQEEPQLPQTSALRHAETDSSL